MTFYFESSVSPDEVPQEEILKLISKVMQHENLKPLKENVIVIEREESEIPDQVVLKAFMMDTSEQKADVTNESFIKPEITQNIYCEVFNLTEETRAKLMSIESTNETKDVVKKVKPRKLKVVVEVRIPFPKFFRDFVIWKFLFDGQIFLALEKMLNLMSSKIMNKMYASSSLFFKYVFLFESNVKIRRRPLKFIKQEEK